MPPHFRHPSAARRLASAGLALTLAAGAAAAPRIEAPHTTFSFGWRDAAETVTNRFALRNAGDAPLLISEVRLSCGCTRAEPASRVVPPGEETAVEVHLALRGLQGQQRKSVTVVSNDPETPYLALWIEGEARPAVCLVPPTVAFGRVDPREPPQPVRVLLGGYLTNVTIRSVVSDSPAFSAAADPSGRSLTLGPPRLEAPGPQRGVVRVTLSDPAQPTLALPLYAYRDDALRVAPSAHAFRPSAEPASPRLVIVRPGTAKRFALRSVAVEGGAGTARALARPGGDYQVVVEGVVPDSLATNAALVIRTDLAERPEWRVPLRREGHAP